MEDTMLMSYVLDAGKIDIIWIPFQIFILVTKQLNIKILLDLEKEIKFSQVELNIAKDYAAEDADITYRLYKIF